MQHELLPPARVPWPPILIAATVALGLALDRFTGWSPDFLTSPLARGAGLMIIVLAIANDWLCLQELNHHATTILPHRAASALVTTGPFSFSRNPIYISHVALTAGIGLLLASLFTILLAPALAFALTKLAIEPEERHLEAKFGDAFREYAARTRRWL